MPSTGMRCRSLGRLSGLVTAALTAPTLHAAVRRRSLGKLTGLVMAALEENPCSDVEGAGAGAADSAAWVAEWMNAVKFRWGPR